MVSDLISALLIAVVQGFTEWLPVSSSGHLVLVERVLGYSGGLMFDVALHFGTLMAVFVYFGEDIVDIVRDLLSGKWGSENGRLGLLVLVATIPAALVGFLLRNVFEGVFNSLGIAALGFGVTGLFLLIGSFSSGGGASSSYNHKQEGKRLSRKDRFGLMDGKKFGWRSALLVGCAQVFALFPGVSRSGSTLSSGLLLGLNEKAAMKFAFLMSIPVIFGANILIIGTKTLPSELIWATLVAFVVGLITIHLLYNYILTSRKNLRWFAGYALLLGLGLGLFVIFS